MNRLKMVVTLAASAFFQIGLNAGETNSSSVEQSSLIKGNKTAETITLDVKGFEELYLIVRDSGNDQAIWASPKLLDLEGNEVDLTTLDFKEITVG